MSVPSPSRVALVAPVFVYVTLITFLPLGGFSWASIAAAIFTALPLLGPLAGRRAGILTVPAFLLFLDVALDAVISNGFPSGIAAEVAGGLLLGTPFWFLGVVTMTEREPGISLLAAQIGLAQSAALLAARATLPSAAPGATPVGFAQAYVNALTGQLNALAQLIRGSAPSSFPLQTVVDPIFLFLAAGALLGIVLLELRSRSAERTIREASERVEKPWRPEGRHAPLALPDQFESVLRGRSNPVIPGRAYYGGLAGVGVATLVAIGFEVFAAGAPAYALLGVVVGAAAALGVIIVLSGARRDRLEPAHPSAGVL